jgi:hypothetical protein
MSIETSALEACRQYLLIAYLSWHIITIARFSAYGSGARKCECGLYRGERWIGTETCRILKGGADSCTVADEVKVHTGRHSISIDTRCIVSGVIVANATEYSR